MGSDACTSPRAGGGVLLLLGVHADVRENDAPVPRRGIDSMIPAGSEHTGARQHRQKVWWVHPLPPSLSGLFASSPAPDRNDFHTLRGLCSLHVWIRTRMRS